MGNRRRSRARLKCSRDLPKLAIEVENERTSKAVSCSGRTASGGLGQGCVLGDLLAECYGVQLEPEWRIAEWSGRGFAVWRPAEREVRRAAGRVPDCLGTGLRSARRVRGRCASAGRVAVSLGGCFRSAGNRPRMRDQRSGRSSAAEVMATRQVEEEGFPAEEIYDC
jgi:hypothetical protein